MYRNWAGKWDDFFIRGFRTSHRFDEVDESALPEVHRMALATIRNKLECFRCPLCRRVGTCDQRPKTIFRDQEIQHFINGPRKGEVEVLVDYWVHLWCNGRHDGPNFRSDGTHHRVICLYLGKLGADGCRRGCAENHIAFRRRRAASAEGADDPTE